MCSVPRLLVLVVLLLPLGGCLGGEAPLKDAADEADGPGVDVANATETVAVEGDAAPHIHDYWNGRNQVLLFDDEVQPGAEETVFSTLIEASFARRVAAGGTVVLLPEGQIVYEGTGILRLTAAWEDPTISSLGVSYKSADGPDFSDMVPLPSGTPVEVPVSPDMTDMPHSTKSRWMFYFAPHEDPGVAVGAFRLTIEVVRMRDVSLFPAHPDLFEGADEKVLLDRDGESEQVSYAKRVPNLLVEGEFGEHWLVPDELVPMATTMMRAEVTLKSAEATPGEVSEIRFYYTAADSYQPLRAEQVSGSVEEGFLVYEFPVEMAQTDSPYGNESQWQLLVEAATTMAGLEQERTCGGCVDTRIEFHVTLTAFRGDGDT